VSERKNNMKNTMTMAEIRRYSQDKAKRLKARAEAMQKNIDKNLSDINKQIEKI
jgi:3-dehydroquinate dehydratase